jgi:hypothetical protein
VVVLDLHAQVGRGGVPPPDPDQQLHQGMIVWARPWGRWFHGPRAPAEEDHHVPEILVDPTSIQEYASNAQGYFDSLQADLKGLVNDIVTVRYEGGNAFTFKTEAGTIAAQFANNLAVDIAAVADAISTSTSNILLSLGNDPVKITVSSETFTARAPEGKTVAVAVETDAMETLINTVLARFESIKGWITKNQTGIEATMWQGTAKNNAVDQVSAFTTVANAKADTANTTLTNYIRSQIDTSIEADV